MSEPTKPTPCAVCRRLRCASLRKHVPQLAPRKIDPERARVLEAELARRGVG